MKKIGVAFAVLVIQSSYAIRDLRELQKGSLKVNKDVVEKKQYLCASIRPELLQMISEPLPQAPRIQVLKGAEMTGFVRSPDIIQIAARNIIEEENTGFLSYRNSTPDATLLNLVVLQQRKGDTPINVEVSICAQGIISFNIKTNVHKDDKIDVIKQKIALMAQWRGQFTFPILDPVNRVCLSHDTMQSRCAQFKNDDAFVSWLPFNSRFNPLKAFIDMSDFEKPEEKNG